MFILVYNISPKQSLLYSYGVLALRLNMDPFYTVSAPSPWPPGGEGEAKEYECPEEQEGDLC